MRNASKGTYYRDPNYELNEVEFNFQANMCLAELKDAIDSGRLTFDSGKIKVDEDPFPKVANINIVVITLLDEGVRDEPRPEGQMLTEEEMRSIRKKHKEHPRVFARISQPMENLCVCCQQDIALVRQMHEERDRESAGPFGTAQEDPSRPISLEAMGEKTFRPKIGCTGEWGSFEPRKKKSVPFVQLTHTQQRHAQRKYGQRMWAAQRREKQKQVAAKEMAVDEDYTVNTVDARITPGPSPSYGGQDDDASRRRPRSKVERRADTDSDEERPRTIQFRTLPP
ncbi:hypothetical protein Droror1_Dr00025985, partial [Drosera rotundifolia]